MANPTLRSYGSLPQHLRFMAAQVWYDLRNGLLFRPFLWTATLSCLAMGLPWLESQPGVEPWLQAQLSGWVLGEPGSAQLLLTTIASAMMTTVSVVYSVLVVALSLASVQFSPRVLGQFLRAQTSQNTVGWFVGTFVYCLLVLRTVRVTEPVFVPVLAVGLALGLALVALSLLIYALHDLATSLQANHIVNRIATETLPVLDEVLGDPKAAKPVHDVACTKADMPMGGYPVQSDRSGYLQLLDENELITVAQQTGALICVPVLEGEFVLEGDVIATIHGKEAPDDALVRAVAGAFDLGPLRTLQRDAEFGFRQIVDVALKAISPAVNDPSTACTCIDQLARLLTHAVRRPLHEPWARDAHGQQRLWLRRLDTTELIDLAFNQLRQYGAGDMAVALRLVRTMAAVHVAAVRADDKARVLHHAGLLAERTLASFGAGDCAELHRRLGQLGLQPPSNQTH